MTTATIVIPSPTIPTSAWIAATATVRGNVTLGEDVSVWFSAVIRGDEEPVTVGDRSNVQDGAVVHVSTGFPCIIGREVTIGHGAGALVAPGTDIPAGMLALGVPAKVVGPLSPAQKAMGIHAVKNYIIRKEDYRSGRL